MGIINGSWDIFINNVRRMANVEVPDRNKAAEFLINVMDPRAMDKAEWDKLELEEKMDSASMGVSSTCADVFDLYNGGGIGSKQVGRAGTWFGLVSAVTEYCDFHTGHQTTDARLNSAWFGANNDLKDRAVQVALELI
jgi:hypothetical protein